MEKSPKPKMRTRKGPNPSPGVFKQILRLYALTLAMPLVFGTVSYIGLYACVKTIMCVRYRSTKRTRADLTKCEKEMDANISSIELIGIMKTVLASFALPITFITALSTSLISLITSAVLYKRNKKPTWISKTQLTAAVLNFISTALLGVVTFLDEDLATQVAELTPAIAAEIVEPTLPLTPREEFLKKVEGITDVLKINDIYRNHYSETDFMLPPFRAPMTLPIMLRPAAYAFEFPDSFLSIWWKIPLGQVEVRRRMLRMISKNTCVTEDPRDDDVIRGEDGRLQRFKPLVYSSDNGGTTSEDDEKMNGFERQSYSLEWDDKKISADSIMGFFKRLIFRIACVFMALADSALAQKPLTLKSIMEYWKLAKTLDEGISDVKDAIGILVGRETDDDKAMKQAEFFTKEFNRFLDYPTHVIAKNLRYLDTVEKAAREYETWQRALPHVLQQKFLALHALYSAASKKRVDFVSSDMPTLSRQEPFVVLLRGKTGVGKTMAARELAARTARDVLRVDPVQSIIDVTPSDKYWPPLNGMREIFVFDEVVAKKTIEEDLLFNNFRGICSPAYFNCAAADIAHKINPFPGKAIFATTNTSWDDLGSRVASTSDGEAWAAYCRRMIMLECERKQGLDYDPNHPELMKWDATNFTHLRFTLYEHTHGRVQPVKRNLTMDNIMTMISERESAMAQKHRAAIDRLTNFTRQTGKAHYSVVFHGQAGQGKSFALTALRDQLPLIFNLPCLEVRTAKQLAQFPVQKKRVVVLMDDVLRNTQDGKIENDFMDLYNEKLLNGSIIISATNVEPKNSRPHLSPFSIQQNRSLSFLNEGVARRLGYRGMVNFNHLPAFNDEIYVKDNNYFVFQQNSYFSTRLLIPFALWIMVLYVPVTILLVSSLAYTFWLAALIRQPKTNGMQVTELSRFIHGRYRECIAALNDVQVRYAPFTKQDDYNVMLIADHSSNINLTQNPKEFQQNLFSHKTMFEQCTLPWKFYITEQIFNEFARNYQRYLVNCHRFDFDVIILLIRKYVNALREVGIEPRLYAEIGDIGRVEYRNGEVVADLVGTTTPSLNFAPIWKDESWNITFQPEGSEQQFVSIADIIANPTIAETLQLSFDDTISFNAYVRSTGFTTSEPYLIVARQQNEQILALSASARALMLKQKVQAVLTHPIAKIAAVILTIAISLGIICKVVQWIKSDSRDDDNSGSFQGDLDQQRRKSRKGQPKKKNYDSDDDKIRQRVPLQISDVEIPYDSDDEANLERKVSRKGTPKKKVYDSDDDRRPQRKGMRKGSPKKRFYDSDDDKRPSRIGQHRPPSDEEKKKEDVLTLADMNGYDSYRRYNEVAQREARDNLCQIYLEATADGKEILDNEPTGCQSCYGLFLSGTMLVTVGHICEHGLNHLYVGSDKFKGFRRMSFIKKYAMRDLSIWYVPSLEKDSINHKDISKRFLSDNFLPDDAVFNAILQRFSSSKREEYHMGELMVCRSPSNFGDNGKLSDYGEVFFGTFGNKVTTGGDCGLPYYAAEGANFLINKIFGIHCMGNLVGYSTLGVLSLITKEDIDSWKQLYSKELKANKKREIVSSHECCPIMTRYHLTDSYAVCPDDKPKTPGHLNVWSPDHDSTVQSFCNEFYHFNDRSPNFTGVIMKNSGSLVGSVEHSHTQFLPKLTIEDIQGIPFKSHNWLKTTKEEQKMDREPQGQLYHRRTLVPPTSLAQHIKRALNSENNFRIRAEKYFDARTKSPMIMLHVLIDTPESSPLVQQISTRDTIQFIREADEEDVSAIQAPIGAPVYASDLVRSIIDSAALNLSRGHQEDTPFKQVENNQTVEVIGSFINNQSPLPTTKYHLSPFSHLVKDIIPVDKMPCVYDMSKIPEEEKMLMAKDSSGQPSQLVTQALQWAHQDPRPDKKIIDEISTEFNEKILRHYSGLRILSDYEVLAGLAREDPDSPYLNGMELDTAIGFTMKQLFYVQKKSDVIAKTTEGRYYWTRNEASVFLHNSYNQAKTLSAQGKAYFVAYNEMLKMEKLKLSKMYVGRSFVVQDTLGVLMERRNLGYFSIRAMARDPNCGVGMDPTKDFHRLYVRLAKHPNIWAGDYKRFDRTEPAVVFEQISKLLQNANPHMANEIKATMEVLIHRFQVTGNTLCRVRGGMPSGCTLTAPLNSLVNEYLMFACYVFIMKKHDLSWSWKDYEDNIERIYYGDDVLVSVSDLYAHLFTRKNVAKQLKEHFGMFLDSAAKDGTVATFDDWVTASWISRFFRKIDHYPFIVGALKKASIYANFHYVTSTNLDHLGTLMSRALYEAAFWDSDFYHEILRAVQRCIHHKPALAKHVEMFDRLRIQKEAYENALPALCGREKIVYKTIPNQADKLLQPDSPNVLRFNEIKLSKRYKRQILPFLNLYYEKIMGTYRSRLNFLFQEGYITRPSYEFKELPAQHWSCLCETTLVSEGTFPKFNGAGAGHSKAEAAEAAAYVVLTSLPPRQQSASANVEANPVQRETARRQLYRFPSSAGRPRRDLSTCRKEMMMTPSHQIPQAPVLATDTTGVLDAALATNTGSPALKQDMNRTGIALNNPAGTGAPFNKHEAVYSIYQELINGNINPSQTSGTEIIRISLDPATWPKRIRDYVNLHNSCIPALDIQIQIAGTAGSIGWLKFGWVRDGSSDKHYSLDDLQQISSKVVNMNGTQILAYELHDVRKTGLYRSLPKDPEPYPAIIGMIESSVTNVQRNDAVNYPFRVQVKLNETCCLMEPFGQGTGPNPPAIFDIGSYMYDAGVDMVVLSSSVPDKLAETTYYPDCGYATTNFNPTFTPDNLVAAETPLNDGESAVAIFINEASIPPGVLTDLADLGSWQGNDYTPAVPHEHLYFAYGEVPTFDMNKSFGIKGTFKLDGFTTYATDYEIKTGLIPYKSTALRAFPRGCIIQMTATVQMQDFSVKGQVDKQKGAFYLNCDVYKTADKNLRCIYYRGDSYTNSQAYCKTDDGGTYSNRMYIHTLDIKLRPDRLPYPFSIDKLGKTFLATGNSAASTPLPTGLKQLSFLYRGTSTDVKGDTPLIPMEKPYMVGVYKGLDTLLKTLKSPILKGHLTIAGENVGEIAYTDETLIVRTDAFKKIKASVGKDLKLVDITATKDLKSIAPFNTTGYADWLVTSSTTRRRRFNLDCCIPESAIAIGIGAGLAGMGQAFFAQEQMLAKQRFQEKMQAQLLANNANIAAANNSAALARQQRAFENQLQLKGYSSTSAQNGGLGYEPRPFVYSHTFYPSTTPQTESQLNTTPYQKVVMRSPSGDLAVPGKSTRKESESNDLLPSLEQAHAWAAQTLNPTPTLVGKTDLVRIPVEEHPLQETLRPSSPSNKEQETVL